MKAQRCLVAKLKRELERLATAATFLTRLPWVARFGRPEAAELARASRYFPLIGVLIGALVALAYAITLLVFTPAVAAVLALTCGVLLTGAFHEDGLADTADGLGGSFERARKLEIMRDSRLGTYGTLALLLLMLAKFSALQTYGAWDAVLALIVAHTLARASSLALIAWLPYVREGSSFKPLADGVGRAELLIAGLISGAVVFLALDPRTGLALIALSAVIVLLSGWFYRRQLGGITGDCLGASNQLIELAILLALSSVQIPS